jgi:hypothetical protein
MVKKLLLLAVAGLVGANVMTGCVSPNSRPLPTAPPASNGGSYGGSSVESTAAPEPVGSLPSPSDFTITVLITKSNCFGSAGCNVQYEISPAYVGAGGVTKQPFRVFYNIVGGDSPQSDSFTITNGSNMHYDKSGSLSTTGEGEPTLSAVVTRVVAEPN